MPEATGEKIYPFIKDPDSTQYTTGINWDGFLNGLTFLSSVWAVISGSVSIISDTVADTNALVQLSGGTVGEKCALRNRVVRSDGEMEDQTIYVKIKEK